MPSQIHRGIFEDQRDMNEVFQKQVKEPTKLSTRYAYVYEYRGHRCTLSSPMLLFYNVYILRL